MAARKELPKQIDYRPNVAEMQAAFKKLVRRKQELDGIDPHSIMSEEDEATANGWIKIWNDTVAEIFTHDSRQYREYQLWSLNLSNSLNVSLTDYGYNVREAREGIARGKQRVLQYIATIEKIFKERLDDAGASPAAQATATFQGLTIHPALLAAIGDRYENGHYEDSVLKAYVAMEAIVKAKANRPNASGTSLMETAFSANSPLLEVADITDPSGKDEQMGMMRLFSGASLAVRNPRAHTLKADTANRALEQIVFLSHLADTVEAAKRTTNP